MSEKLPESITCMCCDAGAELGSLAEALAQGWTGLAFDDDGLWWNYLGLCPECQREEQEERERRWKLARMKREAKGTR